MEINPKGSYYKWEGTGFAEPHRYFSGTYCHDI